MEEENSLKKYSKISSALKYYFLECLYIKRLTIKEVTLLIFRLPLGYT